MCFSANISLGTSAIIALFGIAALRSAKKANLKPLAAIPLLFAIQQASEGILWHALQNNYLTLATIGTYVYLFFAFLWWPVWIPFVVSLLEPNKRRQLLLHIILLLGIAFDLAILLISKASALAHIHGGHMYYYVAGFGQYEWLSLLYYIAVILPFLASSHRLLWFFGLGIYASLLISHWAFAQYVVSIWCFFAAILSIYLWWVVKRYESK